VVIHVIASAGDARTLKTREIVALPSAPSSGLGARFLAEVVQAFSRMPARWHHERIERLPGVAWSLSAIEIA
jgi:hypothetical protein